MHILVYIDIYYAQHILKGRKLQKINIFAYFCLHTLWPSLDRPAFSSFQVQGKGEGDTITSHQGCPTKTSSSTPLSSSTLSYDNILCFSSTCVPVLKLYFGDGEPGVDGCWAE